MTAQTRLSAKGQVVIPKDVRDRLGLKEGTEFDVIERAGEVVLRRKAGVPVVSAKESVAAAVREIRSFYRYEGPALSIEDMDRSIETAVAARTSRGKE